MRYQNWLVGRCRRSAVGLLGMMGAISAPVVFAQPSNIVPDNTLGNNNSIVLPNAGGLPLELIGGGDQRGGNLFHSFQEFNISNGRAAYFNQPQGVINILSRVTGKNPSQILGTLGVIGAANLFLINPNGIIFGPNASLDVGGAFVVSTANAIRLGENGLFSASDPGSSNLLSIQPSALFFNALGQPKAITNQSTATTSALGAFINGDPQRSITGLQVLDGQSLLLVGGPINMPGGKLTAFDGRIELAAIGGQGNVGLVSQGQTLQLSLPANLPRADINFSQEGTAEVSGLGVGSISLYANNFTATGASGLGSRINVDGTSVVTPGLIRVDVTNALTVEGESGVASTASAKSLPGTKATNIVVDAGSIKLESAGFIGSISGTLDTDPNRQSQGDAGNVTVRAKNGILLNGGFITSLVLPSGTGSGGTISLQGRSLTITNNGIIGASTLGQGNAGNISINTINDTSLTAGAQIQSIAAGKGNAGKINLNVGGNLLLNGAGSSQGTGISNLINANAVGQGQDIQIKAKLLAISNDAKISASSFGQGNGGNISVTIGNDISLASSGQIQSITTAKGNAGKIDINAGGNILLDGAGGSDVTSISNAITRTAIGEGQDINIKARSLTLQNSALITSSTLGQGNAGNINIQTTDGISIASGSQIQAATFGRGNAGSLNFFTNGDMTISGTDEATSVIATAVGSTGIGEGKDIVIKARSLTLTNDSILSTSTFGQGNAGNLSISVSDGITIKNGGKVRSDTQGVGNAGKIDLVAGGNILLLGTGEFGSTGISNEITATGQGQGNNISVKAKSLTLTDAASINANTSGIGNAGSILANVDGDITLTNGSLIQAASVGQGDAGSINLSAGRNIVVSGADQRSSGIATFTSNTSVGNGKDITLKARSLSLTNNALVAASTAGKGDAGNIKVDVTDDISIANGQIQSLVNGQGNAGKIDITAGGDILIDGLSGSNATGISNAINEVGVGEGNDITIKVGSLSVINNASVSASTIGKGNAGNIKIEVLDQISLLSGGTIDSVTLSQGDAGQIDINAGGSVLLDGAGASSTTGIANAIGESAIGEGKDISIQARSLTVSSDNAFIGASTLGQGNAGNITIDVSDNISLLSGGQIQSFTSGKGNAGKIDLTAGGNILLQGTGTLGTAGVRNTILSSGIGQGNDIKITGRSLTITDAAVVNASTFGTGNAGNVDIDVTESVSALRGGEILSLTRGNGDAGNIAITAGGQIQLAGVAADGSLSTISTEIGAAGVGNGKDIRLQAQSLNIGTGSLVITSTNGIGNAGSIAISVEDGISVVGGGQIQAATYGQGDAGSISLAAGGKISVDGQDASGSPSLITNLVAETSSGEGADIAIRAESLSLSNGGILGTTTLGQGNAGNIDVQTTNEIFLNGSSGILTATDGQGNGGSMRVLAGTNVFLGNESQLTTSTRGQGNAGNLEVQAGNGIFVTGGSLIQATTTGYGRGGNINLQASGSTSLDGNSSQITSAVLPNTDPLAQGQGGNIGIQAQILTLTNGGLVAANTASNGNAGNINIATQTAVNLSSDSSIDSSTAGIGNGGIIDLATRSLSLTSGGQISAAVVRGQDGALGGQGRGGTLRINADQIDISGVSAVGSPSGLFALNQIGTAGSAGDILVNANRLTISNAGVIAAGTNNLAPGGNITINTTNFSALNGGQVVTASQSGGNAGTIRLNATGDVILAGRELGFEQRIAQLQQTQTLANVQRQQDLGASDRQGLSGLFAGTSPNSTGSSGSIQVNANQLTLRDGATITVDSRGTGNGGNLSIQTGNLVLDNGASLNAATASGEGGNIALNVGNVLRMRQNSLISAQAQGTGNGGNIDINTRFLTANGNSDIIANAFEGRGGNIQITTQGIFGIQPRDSLTPLSDINASSQFGTDGVVQIDTTVDPSRELVSLPSLVVDVSGLIAQGCRAENTTASRFVVTGRGGLPTNPGDLLSNEPVLNDLGQPVAASSQPSEITPPEPKSQAEPRPIVEAQGWVVRPDGKLVLTAQTKEAQPTWFKTPACQGN